MGISALLLLTVAHWGAGEAPLPWAIGKTIEDKDLVVMAMAMAMATAAGASTTSVGLGTFLLVESMEEMEEGTEGTGGIMMGDTWTGT